MVNRFSCCYPGIMATKAGAHYRTMINGGHWFPGVGGVAAITGVSGVDVGRVFTGGCRAVMASRTGLAGGTVVKDGR